MAWRRSGDKPLSEPMMVRLLTHICVTRPQWVKYQPINIHNADSVVSLLDQCYKNYPALHKQNETRKLRFKEDTAVVSGWLNPRRHLQHVYSMRDCPNRLCDSVVIVIRYHVFYFRYLGKHDATELTFNVGRQWGTPPGPLFRFNFNPIMDK